MNKSLHLYSLLLACVFTLLCNVGTSQTTITIGEGTSSSSTRGPFQRSDTASTTVFSRFVQVYTQEELAAAGMISDASITEVQWELASSNIVVGDGDATLKVYIKNSSATEATEDSWENIIAGSSLVVDNSYNTTNNFPGENGWMPFTFNSGFTYTGGALEIAVDWDCSQVSTPAFSGDGSLKWRWESVAPDFLVVKKTSSSAPSTSITDLKDERANIQLVFEEGGSCQAPSDIAVSNITASSADISWTSSESAMSYSWFVVGSGAGEEGTQIDSGTTMMTNAQSTGLTELTGYDLYIQADCGNDEVSDLAGPFGFSTTGAVSNIATIGLGTSSSSTRGPFQRSDTASTTVFSRFVHVYTADELASAGLVADNTVTSLNWELASSNVIIGDGDATLKVYIKNSSATMAEAGDWDDLIAGSELLVDNAYNTDNNFPGENGWMGFDFSSPFVYTGGAIEVAVDWDCSQVSTPAFSGDGSLKWRWEATAPDFLVVKKTSSSSASTNISDLKDERANIQFVYAGVPASCDAPTGLSVANVTMTSADLVWENAEDVTSYNWLVVDEGAGTMGTALGEGTTSELTASLTSLTAGTSYDLYVESICGDGETSGFAGPYNFITVCSETPFSTASVVSNLGCNGDESGMVDLTITEGIAPYSYEWSDDSQMEDLTNVAAGDYSVVVTDANGCGLELSVTIDEPEVLTVEVTGTDDSNGSSIGSASAAVEGGTPPYSYTWNGESGAETLVDLLTDTYEVEVTDANGCVVSGSVFVDNIVGIEELDVFSGLTIAPNPTQGIATLTLDLASNSDLWITVFSLTGEEMERHYQSNVNGVSHNLDLSSFAEGLYFVRLTLDNKTTTRRLIHIK